MFVFTSSSILDCKLVHLLFGDVILTYSGILICGNACKSMILPGCSNRLFGALKQTNYNTDKLRHNFCKMIAFSTVMNRRICGTHLNGAPPLVCSKSTIANFLFVSTS